MEYYMYGGKKKMNYVFDVKVAKKYGVNEAIMISNFQFWITKNMANNKNYHDGKYWTYNSKRALTELFPFWNEQQIKRILNSLRDKGILMTGNYNKYKYDKTLWYAFVTDEFVHFDQSIGRKLPMDQSKVTNGMVGSDQPIPDIKPDKKPDKKHINMSNKNSTKKYYDIDNVLLKEGEYNKLISEYGEYNVKLILNKLSSYKLAHGKKYKSDYGAINQWVIEACKVKKKEKIPSGNENPKYCHAESYLDENGNFREDI